MKRDNDIENNSSEVKKNDDSKNRHLLQNALETIKQNNSRLELAIEAVNMAWWDMDILTGNVIFHPRKAQILDFLPEEFKHYTDFMKLVHPEDQERSMQAMRDHFSGKALTYDTEYRIQTKKGDYKWFYDIGTITNRDEKGKPVKIIGFVIDVTKQKQAEQQLHELNLNLEQKIADRIKDINEVNQQLLQEIDERKKAEEDAKSATLKAEKAMKAKSEFLSRMSHELRTPLNAIMGFAQLLDLGELNNVQRKGVDHIIKGGKQLLDLINEVLDINQIESGRLSFSLEAVQISNIFAEILDVNFAFAKQKNVTINIIYETEANCSITADYQRIKQVINNLVDNAIRACYQDGIVKILVQSLTDEEPLKVRINIIDNGRGIDTEDLPNLFNPFSKVESVQNESEGIGLGLTLVKKLVNFMGGKIGVSSELGKGSTFWVEFPQVVTSTKNSIERATLTDGIKPNIKAVNNILYLEDNASNIELMQHIFLDHLPNLKLITDTKGLNTVSLATTFQPVLILLDLDLPDIHGSEVVDQLKNDNDLKNIPIIIISADSMVERWQNMLYNKIQAFLTKPLDINLFLQTIQPFLSNSNNN